MVKLQWSGVILTFISNILLHSIIFQGNPQILNALGFTPEFFIISTIVMGVMYALYPLFGWLGDKYASRYWLLLGGEFFVILGTATAIALSIANYLALNHVQNASTFWLMVTPVYVLLMLGIGLFESNVLQFGIDQILEASSNQLMTFIKWHYWTFNVGPIMMFYFILFLISENVFPDREYQGRTYEQVGGGSLFVSGITTLISAVIGLCLLSCCSRRLTVEPNGQNPLKDIFQVLKYIWNYQSSQQEQRNISSFDVCKERFGGPFSAEVVENVKNFLQILSIIVIISILQLSGDTYSLMEQLIQMTKNCPTKPVLLVLGINPNHLSYLVTVIAIPVHSIVTRCRKIREVLMLRKIFIGLACGFLALCSQMIIGAVVLSQYKYNVPKSIALIYNYSYNLHISQLTQYCFAVRMNLSNAYNNDMNITSNNINVYWWVAVPQILNGIANLFVSMVILQFICAQASRNVQGILIGGWYATYFVRFVLVAVLDVFITHTTYWFIYKGLKVLVILLMIFIYLSFAYSYHYRQREDFSTSVSLSYDDHVTCRIGKVTKVSRYRRNYGAMINKDYKDID